MSKLEVSFQVGEKVIDAVFIKPLTFAQFSDYIGTAQGMKTPSTFEGRLKRVRMQKQVDYLTSNKQVPLEIEELLRMPIPAARQIASKLDAEEGKAGKIIRDGDGISTAIGYELGTPIPIANGKGDIKELEFLAKTYGDIEDVLSATDLMSQTMALLKTVAKPVHSTLMSLPSWAIDRISVADGVTIANTVTSRFLNGSDEDSERS
jgi:hypothetical protein